MTLKPHQLANLKLFEPNTYAICLGTVGRELQALGLVEWVPPVWGNTPNWRITEEGRAAVIQSERIVS